VASSTGAYRLQLTADTPSGPSLSVADTQVFESDGIVDFEIRLSEPVTETVSLTYATSDQTALEGTDYTQTFGSISFAPGETLKTISVPVLNDDLVNEDNLESFLLTISDVSGIIVADGVAEGSIVNDDFALGDAEGDLLDHAKPISISAGQIFEVDGVVGDGNFLNLDVDLFQVQLSAGQTIEIDIDANYTDQGNWLSSLDSYLRVFDVQGNELASNSSATATNDYQDAFYARDSFLTFQAPSEGAFFIGVSGESGAYDPYSGGGNRTYDPSIPGSGVASSTGAYKLQLISDLEIVTDDDNSDPTTNSPIILIDSNFVAAEGVDDIRTITFSGQISGQASSIEVDVNLDGSADYFVSIHSDSTFSLTFDEPDQGVPQLAYALVQDGSGLSSWRTIDTFLPEPPSENPADSITLTVERIIGDPDDAMSAVETLRGTLDGAALFDSVTLDIDYDGDEFADTYFDVTGTTEFDLNVFEGAMSPSAVARLTLMDYSSGMQSHSPWVIVTTTDLRVAEDPIDDESDPENTGDDPETGDDGSSSSEGGTDNGQSNGQNDSPLLQSIRSAVADSTSPVIGLATSFASASDNHLIVSGTVSETTTGAELTAYKRNGTSLITLGSSSLATDGSLDFRIFVTGELSAGDEVIVHQHDGSDTLGSVSAVFTVAAFTDTDSDGISESIESAAPGGDGNGDGIPDAQQAEVATLIESATGTTTTFDGGGATLVGVRNAVPSDPTVAALVPQGLYWFEIHGVAVGGVHAINVYLDADSDFGVWMKQDVATGEMNEFLFDGETGAVKTDFGFTIYFEDGGRGDDDGFANGIIVDPSGPGYGIGGELNIGYWPSSPYLDNVEIDSLPGIPSGLDDDSESGGNNDLIPDSIQTSMATALQTYQGEIATHASTYQADVATANAKFESSKTTAGDNYHDSAASASNAYQSTHDGFLPDDLQPLQDAMTVAEEAYQVAYATAMQAISERAMNEEMAIMGAQSTRDTNAEEAFQDASEEIYEAAYENSESDDDIDWDAVASDISDAQEIRDNALIESAKTAEIASAELAKSLADDEANAAKGEYDAMMDAAKELQKAATDNDYDFNDDMIEAYATKQRAIAAASATYTKDMADANDTLATDLANALKTRLKDDNASSTTYSKEIATLQYGAVVANETGSTSRISTFRVAVALAAKNVQHAQLDAEKSRRDSYIDSDAILDGEIASATAQQTKDQADASQAHSESLADARESFNDSFSTQNRTDSKDYSDDLNTLNKKRDGIGRDYDKSIAGVNKLRATRTAEELEGNRKAQALNSNRFQNGQIDQATFLAESTSLATEAANKRRDIAKETLGSPPAPAEDRTLPELEPDEDTTESRASMQRFVDGSAASKTNADAYASSLASFSSSLKGWSQAYESSAKGASDSRADDNGTAQETAETEIATALQDWTGEIATAEADYTSDVASAYSDYNIAMAAAVVAYEKGLAQDRKNAIESYATNNPDNIWAKFEAAKAAADLTRTNSVADAYNTYVGATAPAESTVASEVATRQAEYLNDEIDAAIVFEGDLVTSYNTYQSDLRTAKSTGLGSQTSAVNSFEASLATANAVLRSAEDDANFSRDLGNMIALLKAAYAAYGSDNPNQTTILAQKRSDEADTGAEFASTMIAARKAQREAAADAYEQRSADLADASNTFVTDSGNASRDHQKRLADAAKSYQDKIADEAQSSQKDLTDDRHTYQIAMIDADEAYTKSVADANEIHAKATADRWAQFDKDLAALRESAVAEWAGDGVNDPITRYEQYVIDVYAAQTG